jgi:hypothetical protein
MITLYSSCGELEVDKKGNVVECHCDPGDYLENIQKVDLEEGYKFWGEYVPNYKNIRAYDILDFGFWNKDGGYVHPEEDWRMESILNKV